MSKNLHCGPLTLSQIGTSAASCHSRCLGDHGGFWLWSARADVTCGVWKSGEERHARFARGTDEGVRPYTNVLKTASGRDPTGEWNGTPPSPSSRALSVETRRLTG